jgi:dolichyl-diphosphooligosaccharide--protein glycosyltransferase
MMTSTPACIAAFTLTMLYASWLAYDIRLYAIREYGYVIHEFDPWFNYRATEYLDEHGWTKFFHWFDYESWYPLGRPVGTTIYPGMQISSVVIKRTLNALGNPISLNDVCCMVPAWFGVSATWFLALFTSECSGSLSAGAFAGLIMSIVPCHIMRSVGGGYDNESVAMTAMCATFYCWVRALRFDPTASDGVPSRSSIFFGVLCGLAYVYMAAAWGGFVFVVNMIGLHAALLVPLGRYSSSVHRAYTLFFIIGTFGATRVPPVGMNPFKSMEQLMPLAVFIGYQASDHRDRRDRRHRRDRRDRRHRRHRRHRRYRRPPSPSHPLAADCMLIVSLIACRCSRPSRSNGASTPSRSPTRLRCSSRSRSLSPAYCSSSATISCR